jgi:hypothetical protein
VSLGKFDAILIDEVAQSTELSAIVPIVQVTQLALWFNVSTLVRARYDAIIVTF